MTTQTNPIETVKRKDGSRGVYYFGRKVGDYARVTYLPDGSRRWRGVSVHGTVVYGWSENTVRAALMGAYH